MKYQPVLSAAIPSFGLPILSGTTIPTIRGLEATAPRSAELNGPGTIKVAVDLSSKQNTLTAVTPTNGLAVLNRAKIRGIEAAAPLSVALNGTDSIKVSLDTSQLSGAPFTAVAPLQKVSDGNGGTNLQINQSGFTAITASFSVATPNLTSTSDSITISSDVAMLGNLIVGGANPQSITCTGQLGPCGSLHMQFNPYWVAGYVSDLGVIRSSGGRYGFTVSVLTSIFLITMNQPHPLGENYMISATQQNNGLCYIGNAITSAEFRINMTTAYPVYFFV